MSFTIKCELKTTNCPICERTVPVYTTFNVGKNNYEGYCSYCDYTILESDLKEVTKWNG